MEKINWDAVLIGVIILSLSLVAVFLIADLFSPTFSLRKDQWACRKEGSSTTLMPMIVGKSTILMPQTTEECILWEKK